MNQSQKIGLWSIVGLVGSLLIAWYFSRKQIATRGNTSDYNPPADNGMNQYNFNIPPITIPQIGVTIPPPAVIPGSGSGAPAPSGCGCNPCGGTGYVSGSDALNTAIQNSQNWDTLVQNTVSTSPTVTAAKRPYEPLVLTDPRNADLAMVNQALYDTDPVYARAWDNNYNRIYKQKTRSMDCAACVSGGGPDSGWSGSSQTGDFMPGDPVCIEVCLPTVSDMLQAVQQELMLAGDDPNANAVKPVSIH